VQTPTACVLSSIRPAGRQIACTASSTTRAPTPTVYAPSSATSAREANTLRLGHDETRAKAKRLEADVARVRSGPWAERNAAQTEHGRLPRAPARHAYIAARPMAFRELEPGPSWRIRAVAAVLVAAVFAGLVQLLFDVL
jgi:hypothetical protein